MRLFSEEKLKAALQGKVCKIVLDVIMDLPDVKCGVCMVEHEFGCTKGKTYHYIVNQKDERWGELLCNDYGVKSTIWIKNFEPVMN